VCQAKTRYRGYSHCAIGEYPTPPCKPFAPTVHGTGVTPVPPPSRLSLRTLRPEACRVAGDPPPIRLPTPSPDSEPVRGGLPNGDHASLALAISLATSRRLASGSYSSHRPSKSPAKARFEIGPLAARYMRRGLRAPAGGTLTAYCSPSEASTRCATSRSSSFIGRPTLEVATTEAVRQPFLAIDNRLPRAA